ncbi:MAG: hypothetical protein ACLFSY_05455 [Desulfonatronovibrionaceae bacterium]
MHRRSLVLILLAVFCLGSLSPAYAGRFKEVLHNNFCKGMDKQATKIGCDGYLQYRIERGKARQQSFDNCKWGCGETMNDPVEVEECREGCRIANENDY